MKHWAPLIATFYLICLLCALPLFGWSGSAPDQPPSSDPSSTPSPAPDGHQGFLVFDAESDKVYPFTDKEFVLFTVAAELYPQFEEEAIKAQAVATYTYYSVLRTQRRASPKESLKGADFDNVPSTFPDSYSLEGLQKRWGAQYPTYLKKFRDAVDEVFGQMLFYNEKPAHTVYHAISFGVTECASVLWGGNYPYLVSVDSVGDTLQQGYQSTITYSAEELVQRLQAKHSDFVPDDKIETWFAEKPICSDAGTVMQIDLCNKTFTGGEIRRALGLRSACFSVKRDGKSFTFTVKGYGHSVGLSQCGANYMAQQGKSYTDILQHYYPGTVLRSI